MPKGHDAAPEPIAEKLPPNIVMPKPGERKMPSIAESKKAAQLEASAADLREKGDKGKEGKTTIGELERIDREAHAAAQEKINATKGGLLSRLKSIGNKIVEGFKGFFNFIKEDTVLAVKDAAHDIITGRQEDGHAVSEVEQRIAYLADSIGNPKEGQDIDELQKNYSEALEELEALRDPYNFNRKKAAEQSALGAKMEADEEAKEKTDKAEAIAYFKKDAEEKAIELKRIQAEREAKKREEQVSIGRTILTLLLKTGGEDPEKAQISEATMRVIGATVQAGIEAAKAPGKIKAGWEETKQGASTEWADFKENAGNAFDWMTLAEDRKEMNENLTDAASKSISFIGALLKNAPVRERLIALLKKEKPSSDEEREAVKAEQIADYINNEEFSIGEREALIKALSMGAGEFGGKLRVQVQEIVDSINENKNAQAVGKTAKNVGKGLGYAALGAAAIVGSPILIPGAGLYYGAKAANKAYETTGKISKIYNEYAGSSIENGIESQTTTAREKLTQLSPALADAILPVLQFGANLDNAPAAARKELAAIGNSVHELIMDGGVEINKATGKIETVGLAHVATLGSLFRGARVLLQNLELLALAADPKNAEAADKMKAVMDALKKTEEAS